MFRQVLGMSLLWCVLLGIAGQAMAQDNAPRLKSLAVGGVKVGGVLKDATVEAGKGASLGRVAQAMDGQLMDRFQNTRKFQLVARSDIEQLIQEQGVKKAGEIAGAQYLLSISLDDFQDYASDQKAKTVDVRKQHRTIRLLAVAKIYNTDDGRVLETANIPVEVSDSALKTGAVTENGDLTDRLLLLAARESASQIANRVIDVIYPARVLARSGQEVTINRGDGTIISVGQRWVVRGPDTKESDPDTGVEIPIPGPAIGKVRITEVKPLVSLGQIEDEVAMGQIIKGASLSLDSAQDTSSLSPAPVGKLQGENQSGSSSLQQQTAGTGMLVVGISKPKALAQVLTAAEKAGRKDNLETLLAQLDTQLAHRLQQVGKYNLVATSDLGEINSQKATQVEGDFDPAQAAQAFRMKGAKFVIVTTVDDFANITEVTNLPARNQSIVNRTIRASATAKLLDIETGEIVETAQSRRQIISPPMVYDHLTEGNVEGGDDALIGAAEQIVLDVAMQVSCAMYPVVVVDRTDNQITVNMGVPLLQPGKIWSVRSLPKMKKDPSTGKMLVISGGEVAKARIIEVERDTAVAELIDERTAGSVREGCILKPFQEAPASVAR